MHRSVVVRDGAENAGIALVAVRGSRARLAALGIVSSRRGSDVGAVALRKVVERVPAVTRRELD